MKDYEISIGFCFNNDGAPRVRALDTWVGIMSLDSGRERPVRMATHHDLPFRTVPSNTLLKGKFKNYVYHLSVNFTESYITDARID